MHNIVLPTTLCVTKEMYLKNLVWYIVVTTLSCPQINQQVQVVNIIMYWA